MDIRNWLSNCWVVKELTGRKNRKGFIKQTFLIILHILKYLLTGDWYTQYIIGRKYKETI